MDNSRELSELWKGAAHDMRGQAEAVVAKRQLPFRDCLRESD
jgi:hypothetical protein